MNTDTTQAGLDDTSDHTTSDHTTGDQTSSDQTSSDQTDEGGSPDSGAPTGAPTEAPTEGTAGDAGVDRLEREGDIAADYLEELLDISDLDGDLDLDIEGNRAVVSIVGGDLQQLVGRDGEVLEALQEVTRLAVYRETGERSRLMLDVGGFRAQRRTTLEQLAAERVEQVKQTGEPVSLDPMTPFERKVVHDAVAAAGLISESEGVEPRRYVVVLPSDGA